MSHITFKSGLMGVASVLAVLATGCLSPENTAQDTAAQSQELTENQILVTTQDEFRDAVAGASPGDIITLADGTWNDFEILFTGKGDADNPITLTAETKGKVILSGASNLRLAGEHLVVSGLVFKNGNTPTSEVISFRRNKDELAYNSRVTETVIDNYNQSERYEVDFWVMVYGKNNRFDHNHLVGKRNKGVTMAVRLNTEESLANYHRIDHNYFGPRPILGSNGGETLRIGTSHYSRSDSFTTVENNYFDRANGELEIISNKSGKNEFKNNTFFESRGTLTMRHGNNNLVENNVFFGNSADHTGGIRVINAGQKIVNNYMEGLAGTRFGGALVVMNGVPNSPINRYDPVKGAVIENNTLVDSDNIQLGAGSDEERSAVPTDSTFSNNLIYNADGHDSFTIYDDMSGIDFNGNVLSDAVEPQLTDGFEGKAISLARGANGLMYAAGLEGVGVSADLTPTTKDMTGPSWYPKTEPIVPFGAGKVINVTPGQNAIFDAVQSAQSGDTLVLASGDYSEAKITRLNGTLTVKGAGAANIVFERSALFEIQDGGSLQLSGVNVSGAEAPDNAGNSVIRTSPYAMLQNYRLEITGSNFTQMDVNHSFNIVSAAKGTFADNIVVKDSSFSDVTGTVLKLDSESDDYGIYNSEYVTIEDSQFKNIGQALISFYRGGTDESTFGPHFKMTGSSVANVGKDKRNKFKSVMVLHGVQVTEVSGNTFENSPKVLINHTVGEPKTFIRDNDFINMPAIDVNELNSAFENTAIIENNRMRPQ